MKTLYAITILSVLLWAGTALGEPGGYLDLTHGATLVTTEAGRPLNLGTSSTGVIQFLQGQTKLPRFSRSSSANSLTTATIDGADSEYFCLSGGGECGGSRGGWLELYGNEIGGGYVSIHSGLAGGSIYLRPRDDANRYFTFQAASDTLHSLTFGDSGTTALQGLEITASTADTDDDSFACLGGGGSCGSSRGGFLRVYGNENTTIGGGVLIGGGASGTVRIDSADLRLNDSGNTLALQEATGAAACMGGSTCNAATDVTIATSCATTGSRIFLQRTSADTDGVGQMYVKSISNGVNFVVNCVTANDTSTFNWIIFHEAP